MGSSQPASFGQLAPIQKAVAHPKVSGVFGLGLQGGGKRSQCCRSETLDSRNPGLLVNCGLVCGVWPVISMNRSVTSGVKMAPSQPAIEGEACSCHWPLWSRYIMAKCGCVYSAV